MCHRLCPCEYFSPSSSSLFFFLNFHSIHERRISFLLGFFAIILYEEHIDMLKKEREGRGRVDNGMGGIKSILRSSIGSRCLK